MATIDIYQLLRAYNVRDFGAKGEGNADDAAAINRCLAEAAVSSTYGGVVIIPPGNYRCDVSINVPSLVTILGFGHTSRLYQANSANIDVLSLSSVNNVRIANLLIDGNRTNNASSTKHGIYVAGCTDIWLDDLTVKSARMDGIQINDCERVLPRGCRVYDNGRNGILIYFSRNCKPESCNCYDNCRVETIGTADGIRLEMLSADNSIVACDCYESALAGGRQGYGVREATGESVAATVVLGGSMRANATNPVLLEDSTSMALTSLYQKVS